MPVSLALCEAPIDVLTYILTHACQGYATTFHPVETKYILVCFIQTLFFESLHFFVISERANLQENRIVDRGNIAEQLNFEPAFGTMCLSNNTLLRTFILLCQDVKMSYVTFLPEM